MANIKIADLQSTELEFAECSDLELGSVVGGMILNLTRSPILIPTIPGSGGRPSRYIPQVWD